jgi:quercetin dioxygenase-like cupin family protein
VYQHGFAVLGRTFVRYVFARGEGLPRHQHDVDHLTLVAAGRIVARTDDRVLERGPTDPPILFRANRAHEIEALEDGTVVLNVFTQETQRAD